MPSECWQERLFLKYAQARKLQIIGKSGAHMNKKLLLKLIYVESSKVVLVHGPTRTAEFWPARIRKK